MPLIEHAGGWLVEEGIAAHRAIRLVGGEAIEVRLQWLDCLSAESVTSARLIARTAGSARGTALADSGEEILVDRLPPHIAEGEAIFVEVTRAAVHGPQRVKRAQGRVTTGTARVQSLAGSLRQSGNAVSLVRRLPRSWWDELAGEALSGEIAFSGGALLLAPTPAMVTVDVDGTLPPRALALAAAEAAARALPRLDLTGSVAIDFPTLPDKADRRAVDGVLDAALAGWPHERTAMNGFGLVQIVSRSVRPSLLHLAQWRRHDFAWRELLRRAEALEGAGVIELTIHPALERAADPAHLAELERRAGRPVRLRRDTDLAPAAPHAQLVSHG